MTSFEKFILQDHPEADMSKDESGQYRNKTVRDQHRAYNTGLLDGLQEAIASIQSGVATK